MRERILASQTLYDGRVVKLILRDVRLPDGGQTRREIVQHPGAVAIVAFDEDEHVLLVRQYRSAADKTLLEIPAGTLEAGEAPEQCAIRELQEETGYRPDGLEALGGFYAAPGYTTEYIYLYRATELSEARLAGDDDEFIEVERVPFDRALAMIESGDIEDGKTIIGLLRAAGLR